MVCREVQFGVDVQVIFHLRSVGDVESHAGEDVDDFILHDGKRVARAQSDGIGRACQVQFVAAVVLALESFFQCSDALLGALLQFVELYAHLFLVLRGHVPEVCHQFVDGALLTEVFDTQRFQFLRAVGLHGLHLRQELFNLCYHVSCLF